MICLDGVIAGLIGAAIVAIWFLFMDAITRLPLYTPTVLGEGLFLGEQGLASNAGEQVSDSISWWTSDLRPPEYGKWRYTGADADTGCSLYTEAAPSISNAGASRKLCAKAVEKFMAVGVQLNCSGCVRQRSRPKLLR